jgi:hypothetical protein
MSEISWSALVEVMPRLGPFAHRVQHGVRSIMESYDSFISRTYDNLMILMFSQSLVAHVGAKA